MGMPMKVATTAHILGHVVNGDRRHHAVGQVGIVDLQGFACGLPRRNPEEGLGDPLSCGLRACGRLVASTAGRSVSAAARCHASGTCVGAASAP